jgi:hypothetical protein
VTYIDAAIEILRRNDRPMTDAEIIEQAVASGLIESTGKTPRQSMSAVLYLKAKDSTSPVRRIAQPGPTRARRGTVRWVLR